MAQPSAGARRTQARSFRLGRDGNRGERCWINLPGARTAKIPIGPGQAQEHALRHDSSRRRIWRRNDLWNHGRRIGECATKFLRRFGWPEARGRTYRRQKPPLRHGCSGWRLQRGCGHLHETLRSLTVLHPFNDSGDGTTPMRRSSTLMERSTERRRPEELTTAVPSSQSPSHRAKRRCFTVSAGSRETAQTLNTANSSA